MLDLGQVFTNKVISDFMVSLFSKKPSTFLDPCFGKGVFIDSLLSRTKINVTGYELDKELFDKYKLNDNSYNNNNDNNLTLINENFLSAHIDKKFDGIIMNPPYLRHEKIDELDNYGITKESLRTHSIFKDIPQNANYYMYFIVKSLSLLEDDGDLIIIFPESWQGSTNEKTLNDIFEKYDAKIDVKFNVKGKAFETSPLVDVMILRVSKDGKKNAAKEFDLIIEENKVDILDNVSSLPKLNLGFSAHLLDYSQTRRGLTTGGNKIFVNPEIKRTSNLKPIISSPKNIKGYNTKNVKTDSILYITNDSIIDKAERTYLKEYEKVIIKNEKPKTLYNKICKNKSWYEFSKTNYRGIIFSYIIRENVKFILNQTDYIIRDNFYVITPKIDDYLLISLLNNHYVYYQLEILGKRYGKGLLKIQKYDLDKVELPDIKLLSENDKLKLIDLGRKIVDSDNDISELSEEITKILSKYSFVNLNKIQDVVSMYKNDRMVN